jgi:hypothetical protein
MSENRIIAEFRPTTRAFVSTSARYPIGTTTAMPNSLPILTRLSVCLILLCGLALPVTSLAQNAVQPDAPISADASAAPAQAKPDAVKDGQGEGWVSLEPGARPAYVGIQGGTAPVTLFRAPDGEILTYTGNTGNDFMHILRGNGSVPEKPTRHEPGDGHADAPVAGAGASGAEGLADNQLSTTLGPATQALQPFGLSTPPSVVEAMRQEEATPPPPPKLAQPVERPRAKPLVLGSYLRVLGIRAR